MRYDLVVLGSGPSGQRAAVQAAKLGKRVCVCEESSVVGGVCTNTGTIPSKSFRHAVMHLTGFHEKGIYGQAYAVKHDITMGDLLFRVAHVVRSEIDVIRAQLARNNVDLMDGRASFHGPNTVVVETRGSGGARLLETDRVVIATGTVATRDTYPFDGERVIVSDDILSLPRLPRTLAVIGAGVIGVEYATMFAALGVKVTLIDKRDRLLPFVDREIADSLAYHLQQQRVTLRLHEEVSAIKVEEREGRPPVELVLKSGKSVLAEVALSAVGRTGATAAIGLDKAGVTVDSRGRIPVNDHFQTNVPHIYAVGDVVGFPSLASTAMEQGRHATRHAFGMSTDVGASLGLFPYGIYTVPEISMVGRTEDELTEASVPYEVGKARFRELARGQITGDTVGLLKLLFDPDSKKLLGVHVIGEGASEIVHIGQALMAHGGTVEYLSDAVFNYPTMAEAYKVAALDGLNRLTGR